MQTFALPASLTLPLGRIWVKKFSFYGSCINRPDAVKSDLRINAPQRNSSKLYHNKHMYTLIFSALSITGCILLFIAARKYYNSRSMQFDSIATLLLSAYCFIIAINARNLLLVITNLVLYTVILGLGWYVLHNIRNKKQLEIEDALAIASIVLSIILAVNMGGLLPGMSRPELIGKWTHITNSSSANAFGETIEFSPDGRVVIKTTIGGGYLGQAPRVGRYVVLEDNHIRMDINTNGREGSQEFTAIISGFWDEELELRDENTGVMLVWTKVR